MRVLSNPKTKRLLFYLSLIAIVSLGIFLLGTRFKTEDIVDFIKGAGVWAPIVYIIIFASTHIIAPLSGTPVLFAGFALFGKTVSIYTYLATVLSSTANFWVARVWGRDLVIKFVGKKNMERIDEFANDYGIKSLILLRVLQGHLVDFISYAYGLTSMKSLPYFIISVLGYFPSFILWQILYTRIENITDFTFYFVATLTPLLLVSGIFASWYRKKK